MADESDRNRKKKVRLDRIDRRILRDLQDNGRMTNVDLAKRAGISAPPCLRRVRALEEAGLIRGYHAMVDARELGFGVTVFAQVGLSSQAEKLGKYPIGLATVHHVHGSNMRIAADPAFGRMTEFPFDRFGERPSQRLLADRFDS